MSFFSYRLTAALLGATAPIPGLATAQRAAWKG